MTTTQMNIFKWLACLIVMLMPLSAFCDNTQFVGRAPSTVRVGEKFQLTYSANAKASGIRLGDTDAIDILMGPSVSQSSSISVTNGQMTQTVDYSFTYIVKAKKEGKITIPLASVSVNGQQIQSNAVTINVIEANANVPSNQGTQQGSDSRTSQSTGSGNDLIVVQSVNRSSVYEGEPITLTTKVFTRVQLQELSDVKQPELTQFVSSNIDNIQRPQWQQEMRDGVLYQSAVFSRQLLVPQKSGKITISPIEYEFVVKERTRNMGGSIFDDFFDSGVQYVRRKVRSNAITLDIKALPQSNSKTSGGVGDFKFDVSLSPTEVQTDNSVQIKLTVSGEGNLKLLTLPKPEFHSDFDTFDPSETSSLEATASGFKGSRTAEYLIIPRREGDFEIPEIKFVYFNPQQGKYITKTQGPFTIHVTKGDGNGSNNGGQVAFSGGSREQVQYIGKDIRYVHTDTEVNIKNDFFLFSPLFFLCIILPLGIFVAIFLIYRRKVADSMNVSGVKRRRANKAAMKRLKKASQYMKEQKREAFFDEVMRALWGYLSDKLTLPLSVLTKDNAKEEMQKHNISDDAADAFMQLLDTCEFARYAPVEMAESMENVYEQAENVIGQIEGQM